MTGGEYVFERYFDWADLRGAGRGCGSHDSTENMGAWDKGRASHGNGFFCSGLHLCGNRSFWSDHNFRFSLQYQTAIHLAGGTIVLFMGIRLLFRKGEAAAVPEVSGKVRMFLSSFAVGITNPAAILTFLFAFSWFGIAGDNTKASGWLV